AAILTLLNSFRKNSNTKLSLGKSKEEGVDHSKKLKGLETLSEAA
ncbi:hypothetical protein Tco_0560175, partial [Tanacetum coccineum]